ncbi:MAG TPA: 4Fe-4S dicluster domain-containing protein [Gammaproteobacteria bacterium]|nr:4Fe-4S dicluster domain-containing protein [Gammaproteobacteria bacterium]HIN58899.1 4Fe-4S dicluster domain-containing protein [Gammaproteobacteria bacterium]
MAAGDTSTLPRREFLGRASALAGLVVSFAPGMRLIDLAAAKPDGEAASAEVRWGMLVDATRCVSGCDACVKACATEHGLEMTDRPEIDAQWIRKVDLIDENTGREISLPVMCQHCEDAPCVAVCPTGASFRREDGIVLVNKHTCIGCRYCMMACPYKARSFIHINLVGQRTHSPRGKGTVESCTFCVHRVDRDREPACVEACTAAGHQALLFGDLSDNEGELAHRLSEVQTQQLRSDLGTNPGVHYHGL